MPVAPRTSTSSRDNGSCDRLMKQYAANASKAVDKFKSDHPQEEEESSSHEHDWGIDETTNPLVRHEDSPIRDEDRAEPHAGTQRTVETSHPHVALPTKPDPELETKAHQKRLALRRAFTGVDEEAPEEW